MKFVHFWSAAIVFVAMFLSASTAKADGDAARGQTVFGKCAACHAPSMQNKVGPGLADVVGRKAGTVAGFNYSPALMAFGKSWDEQTLDTFLAGPMKLVPGTRMPIALPGAQDRADVIAYLKTLQ
jgi:cytochrome c